MHAPTMQKSISYFRIALILTISAYATAPHICFGQAAPTQGNSLPWQQSSPSPSQHHHNSGRQKPLQPPAANNNEQRDADDRKLNTFADEYYRVSIKSKHPLETLKNLQERVKSYKSMLQTRTYAGAADLIHDTESLERRIEAKKKKLMEEEGKKAFTSPAMPLLPTTLPRNPNP